MRYLAIASLVVGAITLMGAGLSAPIAQAANQDGWRCVFSNGEWWYWLPQGRWVYWRNSRWNDYNASTFVPADRSRRVARDSSGSASGNVPAAPSDIRPFYGHAQSRIDYRSLEAEEIGPFYGHVLPREFLGFWSSRRFGIRPFYGHAGSSSEY
jgi:hypothetical protein